jgi:hypothetical protein
MPRPAYLHGGRKLVLSTDPKIPLRDNERLIRAFAKAIADLTDYVGSYKSCVGLAGWVVRGLNSIRPTTRAG